MPAPAPVADPSAPDGRKLRTIATMYFVAAALFLVAGALHLSSGNRSYAYYLFPAGLFWGALGYGRLRRAGTAAP